MILFWKGAGILVALIWFFSVLAGNWLARAIFGEEVSNGLSNITGEWLAAALTLGLALLLRNQRELRLDPYSGQAVEVRVDHSLFFIPVLVWPAIFFVLGIVVYFQAPAPAPTLIEVTPLAATKVKQAAAAQSLRKGWHIRLEAYWPKGVCSPQHKVEIVVGPVAASDIAFESRRIRIVIPKRQVGMFRGAQLDFGEKDGEEGFVVNNPNLEGEQLEKWGPVLEAERPADRQ